MVMQLRKICQHPFVFREVEDAMNLVPMPAAIRATAKWNATLIRTAGKVALLDRMLPKLFATNHRVSSAINRQNIYLAYLDFVPGTHLLPDDKRHGYFGRLYGPQRCQEPST